MKPLVYLAQPPLTQLNGPYPAVYYLRSFLEQRGCAVSVRDHSIALFEKIFCREGLKRVFADAGKARKRGGACTGADRRLRSIMERFFSEEDRWLAAINRLTAFLRGQDREWGHLLSLANGTLPGGPRFDACLAELCDAKGEAAPEDAPLLAGRLLADIADFITVCLDPGFSLIRYAPSAGHSRAAGFRDFHGAAAGLDGYVMRVFYRPLLEAEWKDLSGKMEAAPGGGDSPLLIGLTIPFPGCLPGALVCAESAKAYFGGRAVTVAGGGYVNTELRFLEEEKIFDYFDYLAFDRGYGALDAILRREGAKQQRDCAEGDAVPLYKTMYRDKNGAIVRDAGIAGNDAGGAEGRELDDEAARNVFPDYSGVDFSRYICPVDDANPMHRLWSDGRWLKAYAAYGCYWHNCAFCDVSLDYIRSFEPVSAEALFRNIAAQAETSGVRGLHLVDEACPPASLLRLARLNRDAGLPLVFWGNIRFEKGFTPDAAALLAAGGLIGVSAGIEVATEQGFARLGKGIGLSETVSACAAFKEAGILVHAYLIYGYWDEDEGEIIDSAETVRQLFAAGLLDSAFWHTFVLTKHSRIYAEKLAGQHPALHPRGDAALSAGAKIFALNDLSFAGEERFDPYAAPLDCLLRQWMRGDTANQVGAAFPFKTPQPRVAPDLVLGLLDSYARQRDAGRDAIPGAGASPARALFLGSRPVIRPAANGAELYWRWRLEDCSLRIQSPMVTAAPSGGTTQAEQAAALLETLSGGDGMAAAECYARLEAVFGNRAKQAWKKLRQQGLALYG